ncbi:hypothetical protein JYU14_00990 [Simkania negevensis]|uniref:Uncharacterized protein n=1 Tax=Simkania negevensis TaxID=83561 RepID=A0ABS3ARB6_9BACT|nr:hypothetical protein [Simkania negevensis]
MKSEALSQPFDFSQKGIDYLEFDIKNQPLRILAKPIARVAYVGNTLLRNLAKVIENVAMVAFNFFALAFTRGKSIGDLWHAMKEVCKGTGTILIAVAFLVYRPDTRTKAKPEGENPSGPADTHETKEELSRLIPGINVSTETDLSRQADSSTQAGLPAQEEASTKADAFTQEQVSTKAVAFTQASLPTQVPVSTQADALIETGEASTQVSEEGFAVRTSEAEDVDESEEESAFDMNLTESALRDLPHTEKQRYYCHYVKGLLHCSSSIKEELLKHVNAVAQIGSEPIVYEEAVKALRKCMIAHTGRFGSNGVEEKIKKTIGRFITLFGEERDELQKMRHAQYIVDSGKFAFRKANETCSVQEYLDYFLRFPVGLKYAEVESNLILLEDRPEEGEEERASLGQVRTAMRGVLVEELRTGSHQTSTLLKTSQPPTAKELKDNYSTNNERLRLDARKESLQRQRERLEKENVAPEEFVFHLLVREEECIERARESCEKNNRLYARAEGFLAAGHQLIAGTRQKSFNLFCRHVAILLGTIAKSCPDLSKRYKELEKRIVSLKNESIDDDKFCENLCEFEKDFLLLEQEWIQQDEIPNRCEYLSRHGEMVEELGFLNVQLSKTKAEGEPWLSLNKMFPGRQIMTDYIEAYTKELALLAMEKHSDCQFLLRVAASDVRSKDRKEKPFLLQKAVQLRADAKQCREEADRDQSRDGTVKRRLLATANKLEVQAEQIEKDTVNLQLQQEAQETVALLQRENVALLSRAVETLQAFVYGAAEGVDIEFREKESAAIDLDAVSKQFRTSSVIQEWQKKLEQRWLNSLTLHDYAFFPSVPKKKQQQLMTQHFREWIYHNTGVECYLFINPLAVEEVLNTAEKERVAQGEKGEYIVGKIEQTERLRAIREVIAARGEAESSDSSSTSAVGFEHDLLQTKTARQEQFAPLPAIRYVTEDENGAAVASNLLDVLHNYSTDGDIGELSDWLIQFTSRAKEEEFQHHRLRVLAVCKKIFSLSIEHDIPVSKKVSDIFFRCYQSKKENESLSHFDFDLLDSGSKRELLFGTLTIALAGKRGDDLAQAGDVRNFLVQFYHLAFPALGESERLFLKGKLEGIRILGAGEGAWSAGCFREIGSALQDSPFIGLEGVEDSVAQKSYQQIPARERHSVKRSDIDFVRSRAGEELLIHELIPFLEAISLPMLRFPQERQKWARAIDSALATEANASSERGKVIKQLASYVEEQSKQENASNSPLADDHLATPLSIFFRERILADPYIDINGEMFRRHDQAIKEFNEKLLQSKEINHVLLGTSREIVRITNKIENAAKRNVDPPFSLEEFAALLRYKAAYQDIQFRFFTGQREIRGYLKEAVQEAGVTMLLSAPRMESAIANSDLAKKIVKFLCPSISEEERIKRSKQWGDYCNNIFDGTLKEGGELTMVKDLRGFYELGRGFTIDAVYGTVYNRGQQRLQLSSSLKNHPDVRLLGIDNFSYSRDANDAFCYFTNDEKGEPIVQVKIFAVDDKVIIQKNLPTKFDGSGSILLQYVSKDQMANLPRSITARMGIETFWRDDKGKFYGFDHDGILQTIFERDGESFLVGVKDKGKFTPTFDLGKPPAPSLLACFDSEDILQSEDGDSFFVPGCGLTLHKKDGAWMCTAPFFVGERELDRQVTDLLAIKKNDAEQALKELEQKHKKICDDLNKVDEALKEQYSGGKTLLHLKAEKKELEAKRDACVVEERQIRGGQYIVTVPSEAHKTIAVPVDQRIAELMGKSGQYCKQLRLQPDRLESFFRDRTFERGDETTASLFETTKYFYIQSSNDLNKAYGKWCQAVDDGVSLQEQQDILAECQEIESIREAIRLLYEELCNEPLDEVLFSQMGEHIYAKDLSGSLLLAACVTDPGQRVDVLEQLASHSAGSLSDKQLALLTQAKTTLRTEIETVDPLAAEAVQLYNYLCFVEVQHYQLLTKNFAHSPLSDRMEQFKKILGELENAQATVQDASRYFSRDLPPAPSVQEMWKKVSSLFQNDVYAPICGKYQLPAEAAYILPLTSGKTAVRRAYVHLGGESLLERLALQEEIQVTPKDLSETAAGGYQTAQREIAGSFRRSGSSGQVAGFLLEEFGLFNQSNLIELFSIPQSKPGEAASRGAFGCTERDIETLFKVMMEGEKPPWITVESDLLLTFYYSVNPALNPFTFFNPEPLRAALADKAYTEEQLTAITERIQNFLARAQHARCHYTLEGDEKRASVEARIESAIEKHALEFRAAEDWMHANLGDHCEVGLKEMRYAILTEDYSKLKPIILGQHRDKITSLLSYKNAREQHEDDKKLRQLLPKITQEEIQQLRRDLRGGKVELLNRLILNQHIPSLRNAFIRYLFHRTEWHHLNNVKKADYSGERNKIELLAMRRHYPVDLIASAGLDEEKREEQRRQLAFLLFEENIGFRCNAPQVRMFRSFLLDSKDPDAIDAAQARMGFGKTALLPIIALVKLARMRESEQKGALRPGEKKMVRYVVPRAVLEDNTYAFDQRLENILGVHVVKDTEFQRYQIDPKHPLESLKLIQSDLDARKAFYEKVRNEGHLLIQWPEIRNSIESQEDDFRNLLMDNSFDENVVGALVRCLHTLGTIRGMPTSTVFDELDDTQDEKSREVNYTQGKRESTDPVAIDPMLIIIAHLNQGKYDPKKPECFIQGVLKHFDFVIGEDDPFISRLLDEKKLIPDNVNDAFVRHPKGEKLKAASFLLRALFSDASMLSMVKEKQPNTHFGVRFEERGGKRHYFFDQPSNSSSLIAVPYEGTNTPKGASVYDNTEVASFATLRYYLSNETGFEKDPHLDFLIEQTKKGKISAGDRLKAMADMLDQEELRKAKDRFYNDFMVSPTQEFREFFGAAVVATQIRYDTGRISSDRYERGSSGDDVIGCSGTVGSTSSYFKREFTDSAADGKMSLEIMGRRENAEVKRLASPEKKKPYLDEVLATIFANANKDTRAITDVAGMCKSPEGTPEAVVRALWNMLRENEFFKDVTGIVYYGKDNVKRLYQGPEKDPILCTTAMELEARKGKKFFTFYDQKHTRGTDVKQAFESHALLTLDKNVANSDVKQAILRFRDLVSRESGQSFSFAMMDDFYTEIQGALDKDSSYTIEAKDVAIYLRKQERVAEKKNALTIFNKEMKAIVKQAASHLEHYVTSKIDFKQLRAEQLRAYTGFLQRRNEIAQLVDPAKTTLHEKYGHAIDDMERDRFIERERMQITENLRRLFECAKQFERGIQPAGAAVADDHWERTERFYSGQVEDSVALFKRRYPANECVRTPSNTADGQCIAVAQAQAQAQAEAQANTMVTALMEKDVEVHVDLDSSPRVRMVATHLPVDLSFLQNVTQKTETIDSYGATNNLVHPDLRNKFRVSPHLRATKSLRTRYFLANADKSSVVLISAEEADKFKNPLFAANRQNFSLFDVNDYNAKSGMIPAIVGSDWKNIDRHLANNMRAVMLGINGCPDKNDLGRVASSTDKVRSLINETQLCDVTMEQLLPHLTRRGDTDIVTVDSFGLSKNCVIDLTIASTASAAAAEEDAAVLAAAPGSSTSNVITISARDTAGNLSTIRIPTNNHAFNAFLVGGEVEHWVNDGTPSGKVISVRVSGVLNQSQSKKFAVLQTQLKEHFESLKLKWKELEAKKAEQERDKKEIQDQIERFCQGRLSSVFLTQGFRSAINHMEELKDWGNCLDLAELEHFDQTTDEIGKFQEIPEQQATELARLAGSVTEGEEKMMADIFSAVKEFLTAAPAQASAENASAASSGDVNTKFIVDEERKERLKNTQELLKRVRTCLERKDGALVGEAVNILKQLKEDLIILRAIVATTVHTKNPKKLEAQEGKGLANWQDPIQISIGNGMIASARCQGRVCRPMGESIDSIEHLVESVQRLAEKIAPTEKRIKELEAEIGAIAGYYNEAEGAVDIVDTILGQEQNLSRALFGRGLQLVPKDAKGDLTPSALFDLINSSALLRMRTGAVESHAMHFEGRRPEYNFTVDTLERTLERDTVQMTIAEATSLESNIALRRQINNLANQFEQRSKEVLRR